MKNQMLRRTGVAFAFGLALAASTLPAQAVVLENKWRAGEKLNYNLALDGVSNVQLAPDVPFFLAGVPLEIGLKGNGRAQLETLKVDGDGTGTVALQIPRLKIEAQTFGQKGLLTIENGQSRLTLNGKPLGGAGAERLGALSQNKTALKIGRDGRIVGFEALDKGKGAQDEKKANSTAGALNRGASIASLLMSTLPALWPGRDIAPGESWKANVGVPNAVATEEKTNVGEFELTLKEQETVANRQVWRVAVNGTLATPQDNLKWGAMQLDEASTKVNGDLWFDAQAGQIVRGEVSLESRAQGRNNRNGEAGEASWFDFAGTLEMNMLDNVATR